MKSNIVVVGGGPAGVEAAITAASCVKKVTLVSDRPVGTWHQLMPSRVWLTVVDQLYATLDSEVFPLQQVSQMKQYFDLEPINSYVRRIADQWNAQTMQKLERLGVQIVTGTASLESQNQVRVSSGIEPDLILQADAIIVATGSVPFVTRFSYFGTVLRKPNAMFHPGLTGHLPVEPPVGVMSLTLRSRE